MHSYLKQHGTSLLFWLFSFSFKADDDDDGKMDFKLNDKLVNCHIFLIAHNASCLLTYMAI